MRQVSSSVLWSCVSGDSVTCERRRNTVFLVQIRDRTKKSYKILRCLTHCTQRPVLQIWHWATLLYSVFFPTCATCSLIIIQNNHHVTKIALHTCCSLWDLSRPLSNTLTALICGKHLKKKVEFPLFCNNFRWCSNCGAALKWLLSYSLFIRILILSYPAEKVINFSYFNKKNSCPWWVSPYN